MGLSGQCSELKRWIGTSLRLAVYITWRTPSTISHLKLSLRICSFLVYKRWKLRQFWNRSLWTCVLHRRRVSYERGIGYAHTSVPRLGHFLPSPRRTKMRLVHDLLS